MHGNELVRGIFLNKESFHQTGGIKRCDGTELLEFDWQCKQKSNIKSEIFVITMFFHMINHIYKNQNQNVSLFIFLIRHHLRDFIP